LRKEADAGSTLGEIPGEVGAAFDGGFEPCVKVAAAALKVESDLDEGFVTLGELAYLERAGVGGGLPVDAAGAFAVLVGAEAVEVVTAAAAGGG